MRPSGCAAQPSTGPPWSTRTATTFERRAEEPGVPVQQLLREIRERGYPGSSNLLVRYLNQGSADAERPHIAPRKAAQILLTRPDNLTDGQRETAVRLASACPEIKAWSA